MKARIEKIGNIEQYKVGEKYNLIDLIIKYDKKKIKQHKVSIKSFKEKVILENPELNKHKKFFKFIEITDIPAFLFFYLIGSLMELVYFEVFGVNKYEDLSIGKYNVDGKIITVKQRDLILLIKIIMSQKGVNSYITASIPIIIKGLMDNPKFSFMSKEGISINMIHSELSKFLKNSSGKIIYERQHSFFKAQTIESPKANIKEFGKSMDIFIRNLSTSIKEDKGLTFLQTLICCLEPNYLNKIQPYLLLISSYWFYLIDQIVCTSVTQSLESFIEVIAENKLYRGIIADFGDIATLNERTSYEDNIEHSRYEGKASFKRISKNLSKETEIWHNSIAHKKEKETFNYVAGKYNKLLMKCPLSQKLTKTKKITKRSSDSFCQLSLSRDPLGRAQRIKELTAEKLMTKEMKSKNNTAIVFSYLRYKYLAKVLLLRFLEHSARGKVISKEYLSYDFKFEIVKKVFEFRRPKRNETSEAMCETTNEVSFDSKRKSFTESIHSSIKRQQSSKHTLNAAEVKIEQTFEAEVITLYGAIYGKLRLSSLGISFKSEKWTKEHSKKKRYQYGSSKNNKYNKKLNKKWRYNNINEIIVKRYSLIRQAAEIYFKDASTLFISFFNSKKLKGFIRSFQYYVEKGKMNIMVVKSPERSFAEKEFMEQWCQGQISNFEYIMILNKYAGRSFNDISQYFVFPWIIGDYKSKTITLGKTASYRNLFYPISGISRMKQEATQEKLYMSIDERDFKKEGIFQFGTHYLAGRMVLGYLLRLEPFASLLLQFEGQQDSTARMFDSIGGQWEGCNNNLTDNKELVPEFFYLPETFENYNKYSFGVKRNEKECSDVYEGPLIRVDRVIMPNWALNQHYFVMTNYLALESKKVSKELGGWIDLIFGEKQQDARYFNRFKDFCDETSVLRMVERNSLTYNNVMEIQEFGSNPIKLFKEAHKEKEVGGLSLILAAEEVKFKPVYSLTLLHELGEQVVSIIKSSKSLIFSSNHRTIYKTGLKSLKSVEIKPDLKIALVNDILRKYPKQLLLPLNDSLLAITTEPYDNSCKVYSITKDLAIRYKLHFHRSPVVALWCNKEKLFSGSLDGTIAMWDITSIETKCPEVNYCACNHKAEILAIDYEKSLDLLISGSKDNCLILRVVSTWKLFRRIKLKGFIGYSINEVKLSPRGYILVILSQKKENDIIIVYSINAELISTKEIERRILCVIFDNTGYQFFAGGTNGTLCKYDLLSLNFLNLFNFLDDRSPINAQELQTTSITSMNWIIKDNSQKLLIGTNSGKVYIYEHK